MSVIPPPSNGPKELRIAVPGPWTGSGHFIQTLRAAEPSGRYAFTGRCLRDALEPPFSGTVYLELRPRNVGLVALFEQADNGCLTQAARTSLREHVSVACLRMAVHLGRDGPRLQRFTHLLQRAGGAAIHVETFGIAHAWERWFLLTAKLEQGGRPSPRPQNASTEPQSSPH